MSVEELVKRLRERAAADRDIQRNNEAVANALQGQFEAFDRQDGSHNTFAVRLGLDHKKCAEHDAKLAADWDEAADKLEELATENERLREAIKYYAGSSHGDGGELARDTLSRNAGGNNGE